MNRRTTLKAVGASILAGATLTGTTAASDDDPRVVAVDSETGTDDTDAGETYSVTYGDDGTVALTGETTVPEPCYEAELVGVEPTRFGDVVRVKPARNGELCPQVVSRLSFRIELAYADDANAVFLEFVDD